MLLRYSNITSILSTPLNLGSDSSFLIRETACRKSFQRAVFLLLKKSLSVLRAILLKVSVVLSLCCWRSSVTADEFFLHWTKMVLSIVLRWSEW